MNRPLYHSQFHDAGVACLLLHHATSHAGNAHVLIDALQEVKSHQEEEEEEVTRTTSGPTGLPGSSSTITDKPCTFAHT